jgi:hypothetical protein
MNKDTIRIAAILVFGVATVFAGCQDGAKSKAKTDQSLPSSVGREYGEALRGAIDKAHGAKSTLEAASRTLDEANDTGK